MRPAGYRTPVKTRILAGGIHSAKQQVVRIDRVGSSDVDPGLRAAIGPKALAALAACDAVLVSDYGSGLVTPDLVAKLRAHLRARARRREVPILVDSRYDLLRYRGLTACTPNESEVEQLLGVRINDTSRVLERAGRAMLQRTRMQRGARHARQPRHGAVRAGSGRPCTSRSSGPTRWPT